ncbi:hypothetical protein Pmani_017276 [Petrolisthes manimaculis]|uniref:Uncharacterized protein n=1 Tax=Petrolisthes manimaculis TaxID=1843537 RepID=A0AAE1PNE5_9EUCA|nr:hypothetical protein Pmani_017276 [Petrolisthes manimaculis]
MVMRSGEWVGLNDTKWKRQTAVGLELLAEAGNYAALQRLYGHPYWPPSPALATLTPTLPPGLEAYYRQAVAALSQRTTVLNRPLFPSTALSHVSQPSALSSLSQHPSSLTPSSSLSQTSTLSSLTQVSSPLSQPSPLPPLSPAQLSSLSSRYFSTLTSSASALTHPLPLPARSPSAPTPSSSPGKSSAALSPPTPLSPSPITTRDDHQQEP